MKRTFAAGLLQRCECILPTWRGWLALVLVVGILSACTIRFACDFLTVHDPAPGGVLVVEGWVSPGDCRAVLAEFRAREYAGLYVTGGPIEADSPLAAHRTYAELTAGVLQNLGADPGTLHVIPGPAVNKDRTFSSARALKEAVPAGTPVTIMTGATHSRRSRLLFEKAFGPGTRVGVIALEERGFDPTRWWRSSAGVRTVISEMIAYLYARFAFQPPAEKSP
jgi:hypothetical protein